MKRVALTLTALAILFVAADAAEARGYHHGPRHGHRYGHSYGYRGAVVMPPRVLMGTVLTRPQMYVPTPSPRYWYRPAPYYRYRYYAPAPHYNFYYRGRGMSFGFGC